MTTKTRAPILRPASTWTGSRLDTSTGRLALSCPQVRCNLRVSSHVLCTNVTTFGITEEPDIENVTQALRDGPYGRCAWECDNDVMDNQVVNMQYEGGATVNLTTVAFTKVGWVPGTLGSVDVSHCVSTGSVCPPYACVRHTRRAGGRR